MGQFDNGKKSGSSNRGSVNNAGRLRAFADGADNKRGLVNWDECSPKLVGDVVSGIVGLGGAVTFGRSRDGGATSLTLLLDGDRKTLWFNGDADLDQELEKVVALLATLG